MKKTQYFLTLITLGSVLISSVSGINALAVPELPNIRGLLIPVARTADPAVNNTQQSTSVANLTVTPAGAIDSASTPYFGLDLTTCVYVLDWERYMANPDNNAPYGTAAGEANGCVTQNHVTTNLVGSTANVPTVTKDSSGKISSIAYNIGANRVATPLYKDFEIEVGQAKAVLGDMPVMGIFPNANMPAQSLNSFNPDGTKIGDKAVVDRSKNESLTSIFTEPELQQIYTQGGPRTGMPRSIHTNPEGFKKIDATGALVDCTIDEAFTANSNCQYQGGYCKMANGKMVVRTAWNETAAAPKAIDPLKLFGKDPATPITSCALPNPTDNTKFMDTVTDNNLQVYQFMYIIPYWTAEQCTKWAQIPADQYSTACLKYFQDRYSKVFTGTSAGNKLVATYTFYQSINDLYTEYVPWVNPDINGPRKNFTSTASEASLREFYLDKTTASDTLKTNYEAWIRNWDGFSVYTM